MQLMHDLFGDTGSDIAWWQMGARAVLIFVYAFALFSLARRALSRSSPLDMVVAVIVGSALSRAMTANVPLFPTMAAALVLIIIHAGLARLASHFKWVGHVVVQRPERVVYRGWIDWHAMHKAQLSRDDLDKALRESGLRELSAVRAAYLEADGRISIIRDGD